MLLRWSIQSKKDLERLDMLLRKRITSKMLWFAEQKEPLLFAKYLTGSEGLYRFRIGAYRVIVMPNGTVITILRVKKRTEAYT